jgi:hypothetical protein
MCNGREGGLHAKGGGGCEVCMEGKPGWKETGFVQQRERDEEDVGGGERVHSVGTREATLISVRIYIGFAFYKFEILICWMKHLEGSPLSISFVLCSSINVP